MAPIIHFVRHAEAYHNIKAENSYMLDPNLTPHGEKQSRKLREDFPFHDSIDMLVASPLHRTMNTALIGFKPETDRGLKVIAMPELQEVGDFPCDTGSDVKTLKKELEGKPVDLSLVPEGWNSKKGEWGSTDAKVKKRVSKVRHWLKARPEKNIVVVTHGGLVHFLTEDWSDDGKYPGTGWANTEFRSYRFVNEEGDSDKLIETDESRERRKGTEKPLTGTEKKELKAVESNSQGGKE